MSNAPVLLSSKIFKFGNYDIVFQGRYTSVRDVIIIADGVEITISKNTIIRVEKIEETHIVFKFYADNLKKFVAFNADQTLINDLFI